MKKKLKYILISLLAIFGIARITGMITYYDIASSGTEPNLKLHSNFVGSNLITPKRLDFAYYDSYDEILGNIIIIQRIIALPNDVVQCIEGEFYVNDINVDKDINLRRIYRFDKSQDLSFIHELIDNDESIMMFQQEESFIDVTLDEDYAAQLKIPYEKYTSDSNLKSLHKELKSKNNHSWTINNFGPITIPEGKYFFVGDNRDNSIDSRHKGVIDKKDIKGKLLFQF